MIGFPITYGDLLEQGNGFTTQALETKVVDYWDDDRKALFFRGYRDGLLIFSAASILLFSQAALAVEGSGTDITTSNPSGTCTAPGSGQGPVPGSGQGPAPGSAPGPAPGPAKPAPGSLANVPTADGGALNAAALTFCGIAFKTGAYWVGFACAGLVILGARMANLPAPQH